MTNWKTTVAGIIAAVIISLQTVMSSLVNGTPLDWRLISLSVAIAVLGVVAQDIQPKKEENVLHSNEIQGK